MPKTKKCMEDIDRFIKDNHFDECGIIYCLSRMDCEKVAEKLQVSLIRFLSFLFFVIHCFYAGVRAQDSFLSWKHGSSSENPCSETVEQGWYQHHMCHSSIWDGYFSCLFFNASNLVMIINFLLFQESTSLMSDSSSTTLFQSPSRVITRFHLYRFFC